MAASALEELKRGERAVFVGPISDNDGELRVTSGTVLTVEEIEEMSFFVDGVHVVER